MEKIAYRPSQIESKWQEKWEEKGIYHTPDNSAKPKRYILDMFPYPSGAGLHMGHTRIYTGADILARYFRMSGFNVLHPTGWDAFGLPAENAALKSKIHPKPVVEDNIANVKRQMKMLGLSYDWTREINTSDPAYYRFTQWLFLQFFKMGMLQKKAVPVNWCPKCLTVLADEEVLVDGTHERCGSVVVRKEMNQWVFDITRYADRLLDDLNELDWPESIVEMQRNWVGRSEGAEIEFRLDQASLPEGVDLSSISVFTTRPDTIFGVTAVVLAPEHSLTAAILLSNHADVKAYVDESKRKSELERTDLSKEKTGVFTGIYALNPLSGERVAVWVGDYVIGWYGKGAVMVVPAHDQRDFEFAKKYDLPVNEVIQPTDPSLDDGVFEGEGILVNSGDFSGVPSAEARRRIVAWLEEHQLGRKSLSYKLREWIFSRQRYWGEPIPLVFCEACAKKGISWFAVNNKSSSEASPNLAGWFPVPDDGLPVELPYVEHYEPTGTGESPLANIAEFVNTACPYCGGAAKRETDTMPNWAGSCWYFLRFADPQNDQALFDSQKVNPVDEFKGWLPVDWYVGGAEHAVLHLLYSRFWVKMLHDLGLLTFSEPFTRLRNVGMVQGEGGRKMSKSLGNVVNPDEVINAVGADALRLYIMFMGPFNQAITWDSNAIEGTLRFLRRVWEIGQKVGVVRPQEKISETASINRAVNKLTKKVGEDIESFKFNTAIAAFMEFLNEFEPAVGRGEFSVEGWKTFLLLLAPFAPYITEELWHLAPINADGFIHRENWPTYDSALISEEKVTIVVQVNGKTRDRLVVKRGTLQGEIESMAKDLPRVKVAIGESNSTEIYYVEDRLINFAIKDGK